MGKVIRMSWPIGALLLALNPIFLAVENILTSKDLWLGVPLTGDSRKALGAFRGRDNNRFRHRVLVGNQHR